MEEKKEIRSDVTIRFAGDSGDGMQLIGKKFSDVLASNGIDLITFPDFPSEIRAPEGTLYGVSAFQVRLGSKDIQTHGDEIDVLVAMNASSLKVNLENLKKNGIIIANIDGFDARNLKLAEYEQSPLDSDDLNDYHVIAVDMVKEARKALSDFNINPKVLKKSKNFFALGLTFWLINQSLEATLKWIQKKFKNKAEVMDANMKVLELGWQFGKTQTLIKHQIEIGTKKIPAGKLPERHRKPGGRYWLSCRC
jgi:2-oxoglutarate ferredoxin oxidoreductase subunit alpha